MWMILSVGRTLLPDNDCLLLDKCQGLSPDGCYAKKIPTTHHGLAGLAVVFTLSRSKNPLENREPWEPESTLTLMPSAWTRDRVGQRREKQEAVHPSSCVTWVGGDFLASHCFSFSGLYYNGCKLQSRLFFKSVNTLDQWSSTFLMLQPFNKSSSYCSDSSNK